ncbi:MAG: hypothetical protein RQ751_14520, partial [Longimicrobiales bacterium]|nr:hypothetical protein [Longimicrobiales bacterium]
SAEASLPPEPASGRAPASEPEHVHDSGRAPAYERLVLVTPRFVSGTLLAPLDPFHLRIFPRDHAPSLALLDDAGAADLASHLLSLTRALEGVAPGVAWNLLVHDHGPAPDVALHWHLELRPRVGRTAGFELISGMGVSPSDPVEDAALLRTALPSPNPTETPRTP